MNYDLKLKSKVLLTMDSDCTIIEDGAILIADGKILEIGSSDAFTNVSADKILDFPTGLAMPGLVNTHTHVPMSCFRGLADDLPLNRWLDDFIFPAESAFLNPEVVYWSSMLSAAEMALSGTTCFADGYFFEHDVARAIEKTGIRSVLAQGVIDFPAPGVPDPALNVQKAIDFVKEWQDRSPLITPAIFCHSPYTCSTETLKKSKLASRDLGTLFFIHLSETKKEVEEILSRHGLTPARYLHSIGLLNNTTVAVHCIWLSDEDMDSLAATGTMVSHTPESEMKLGSGSPPVPELLERGVTVSLGTDGCASNNDQDMFLEMDVAAKLQKVRLLDPTALAAREVVWMSTMGGARALGLDHDIGSLEKGKFADIVILNLRKPHLIPLYDYYSHLVYAAKGSDVDTTLVNGKIIVENGKLAHLDVDSAMNHVIEYSKEVRKRILAGASG